MRKTKTILSAGFMLALSGIIMIGGCKKDTSSNEDWASGVAGVYTFTNSTTTPSKQTTVNVQKLTNKTVSIDIDVTETFGSNAYNDFITPVTLTSATAATFSKSTNDCDSFTGPPSDPWIYYCERYTGTATFTSNSVTVTYGSNRTYRGNPEDTTAVVLGNPIIAKK